MISYTKCIRLGMLVGLLVVMTVSVSNAKILKRFDSSPDYQDLFLLGFGELTMQTFNISGGDSADVAFEQGNPNLKADFGANYRMSLFANGNATRNFRLNGALIIDSRIGEEYRTMDPSVFRLKMSVETTEPIWDGWRFTGHGVFDPQRQWEMANLDKRLLYQPQESAKLELLMRLESDEYGLIEGGSLRPSFEGAQFTLHKRSVFGAYANLHKGRFGGEAVAGKLEGKSFREGDVVGIRADGTSGPYDLEHTPITRGSEDIKIQVRDRYDTTTVISSKALIRDIDYNIDYLRGRVLLHQPVASETAAGDPIYIVLTYDYLREYNDEIFGGRARVTPIDEVTISGSLLHRNIDSRASGDGIDEPEDVLAADATLKLDDHTTGYIEVAGSENPNATDKNNALRLGAKSEVIDGLTLNADFQKIDDQFRSFTNSDLDPVKNQQRLNLGGSFDLTNDQTLNASYANLQGLEANGRYNYYSGLRDEKIYRAGYRNNFVDPLGFGVRVERRKVQDRNNTAHEDNTQDRAMLDVDGQLEDFFIFGKFGYAANYEHIRFRNEVLLGRNDANTNQLVLTLTSQPSDNASLKVAHRVAVRKDLDSALYDDRQDATFLTVQWRPGENFNTLTNYEYKRYTVPGSGVKLWQGDPIRSAWAGNFALEYLPIEKIKALGKIGRRRAKDWVNDSTRTNDFILGQVSYFYTHHLSFHAESEVTKSAKHAGSVRIERDRIWDLGLRVNWNRDRFHEFTAGLIRRDIQDGLTGTESASYIVLLSGSLSLTERFFARGSVKGILLNDPIDDEKTFAKLEVGYDSHDWYRISIGYERIQSDNDQNSDWDYTGQGIFVRFTGKM
ncbi:MAG: hypothetical protein J7J98_04890 [candidate division Zixibacteria bacterium]|nr:hypothetical protein [candidate division Zixibacteria bacterium]